VNEVEQKSEVNFHFNPICKLQIVVVVVVVVVVVTTAAKTHLYNHTHPEEDLLCFVYVLIELHYY
jgi:hypothetical protein